jgi:hypothetical protein
VAVAATAGTHFPVGAFLREVHFRRAGDACAPVTAVRSHAPGGTLVGP